MVNYLYHGLFLQFAFGVVAAVQIFSNRYFKHYWKSHMWVHRIGGLLMLMITYGWAIAAINNLGFMNGTH